MVALRASATTNYVPMALSVLLVTNMIIAPANFAKLMCVQRRPPKEPRVLIIMVALQAIAL